MSVAARSRKPGTNPTERRMTCPVCNSELVGGSAEIRGSFFHFLFLGLSYQSLFFRRKNDLKGVQVLRPHTRRDANLCETCGTVVLQQLTQRRRPAGR